MSKTLVKNTQRSERRKLRVRSKIKKNTEALRVSVHRSNKHVYAQVIDDGKQTTLFSGTDSSMKTDKGKAQTKTEKAYAVGSVIGKKLMEIKAKKVVFDRGPYKFNGRVKALATGIRAAGVEM